MTDETNDAGWHADPTGQHAHRYFDGTNWTEHVSGSSAPLDAPSPTQATTDLRPPAPTAVLPPPPPPSAGRPAPPAPSAVPATVTVVELPDTPERAARCRTFGWG